MKSSRALRLLAMFTVVAFFPAVAVSTAELVVPDGVIFERDIEYANPDNQHLQLNLARPKGGTVPMPAVLCIHGGGFRGGTREGYDGLCVRLAGHGFVAATVT